ncbi:MAG: ribosomal-protein-alanine N-acetyltransferase [Ruminococcaceae bacterium]|nr:ribosomal-protein-alanine N-acetyltransferase [Oscillospiraceae bacterium]
MELRRATASDAGAIAAMESEYFSDAWGEKDILSYISSELSMCYAALSDGELIGYILGRKIVPEGEIYRVAVKKEKRERGIGSRLLLYAISSEREEGVESLFLEVREENAAARRLYSSAGFEEIGFRKNYYKSPDDNAIIMFYGIKCQ